MSEAEGVDIPPLVPSRTLSAGVKPLLALAKIRGNTSTEDLLFAPQPSWLTLPAFPWVTT